MNQIQEYTLITSRDFAQFKIDVNKAIKEGWQPLGGVSHSLSVSSDLVTYTYAQAMVK